MAQQLKFIGCLQLMMEELSNLASGLGVDGGQLRYQLYLWLERQVDALIDVCHYDGGTVDGEEGDRGWGFVDYFVELDGETNGRFDSCNSCKLRLTLTRPHEFT